MNIKKCPICGASDKILVFNDLFMQDLCKDCSIKLLMEARQNEPERFLRYCGVPREYRHCSFENFKGNIKLVEGFKRYISNVQSCFIFGICGCGKTHLVIAVMREFVKMGIDLSKIEFIPVRSILQQIKASYQNLAIKVETEGQILLRYSKIKFLVLDDFGFDEKPSNNQINIFYSLLDERINSGMITVVTSNLTLDEIEKNFGARISSRLASFVNVKISMDDYRKKRSNGGLK